MASFCIDLDDLHILLWIKNSFLKPILNQFSDMTHLLYNIKLVWCCYGTFRDKKVTKMQRRFQASIQWVICENCLRIGFRNELNDATIKIKTLPPSSSLNPSPNPSPNPNPSLNGKFFHNRIRLVISPSPHSKC